MHQDKKQTLIACMLKHPYTKMKHRFYSIFFGFLPMSGLAVYIMLT